MIASCGSTQGSSTSTVPAPDITRRPRADRIAFGAAGLGRVLDGALELRDAMGAVSGSVPLGLGLGLVALGDGTLLALERAADLMAMVCVAPDVGVRRLPTRLPMAREPVTLLADPGDRRAFWQISEDRQQATRHTVEGDEIRETHRIKLDNLAKSDVLPLASGELLLHANTRLNRVGRDGSTQAVAWKPPAPVERFAALPGGTMLALDLEGGLHWIDLAAAASVRSLALGGRAMALAADASGVAVLTGVRVAGGTSRWTLHLHDLEGALRWRAEGDGEPGRGLALSAGQVALGDQTALRMWDRGAGGVILAG